MSPLRPFPKAQARNTSLQDTILKKRFRFLRDKVYLLIFSDTAVLFIRKQIFQSVWVLSTEYWRLSPKSSGGRRESFRPADRDAAAGQFCTFSPELPLLSISGAKCHDGDGQLMTEEERSWPSTSSPNFMIDGSNRYRRSFRVGQKSPACYVSMK